MSTTIDESGNAENDNEKVESTSPQIEPFDKQKPSDVEERTTEAEANIEEAGENVHKVTKEETKTPEDKEPPFPTHMEHGDAEATIEGNITVSDSTWKNVEAKEDKREMMNDKKTNVDEMKEKSDQKTEKENSEKEDDKCLNENPIGDMTEYSMEVMKKLDEVRKQALRESLKYMVPDNLVENAEHIAKMEPEAKKEIEEYDELDRRVAYVERELSRARKQAEECFAMQLDYKEKFDQWRRKFLLRTDVKGDNDLCSGSSVQNRESEEEGAAAPAEDKKETSSKGKGLTGLELLYRYLQAHAKFVQTRGAKEKLELELMRAKMNRQRRDERDADETERRNLLSRPCLSLSVSRFPEGIEVWKEAKTIEQKRAEMVGESEERGELQEGEREVLSEDLSSKYWRVISTDDGFKITDKIDDLREKPNEEDQENISSGGVMGLVKWNTARCDETHKNDQEEDKDETVNGTAIKPSAEKTEESARASDLEVKKLEIEEDVQEISGGALEPSNLQEISGGALEPSNLQEKTKERASTSDEEVKELKIAKDFPKISGMDLGPLEEDTKEDTKSATSSEVEVMEPDTVEDVPSFSAQNVEHLDLREPRTSSDVLSALQSEEDKIPREEQSNLRTDDHEMQNTPSVKFSPESKEEVKEPKLFKHTPKAFQEDIEFLDIKEESKEYSTSAEGEVMKKKTVDNVPKFFVQKVETSGIQKANTSAYVPQEDKTPLVKLAYRWSDYYKMQTTPSVRFCPATETILLEEEPQGVEGEKEIKEENEERNEKMEEYSLSGAEEDMTNVDKGRTSSAKEKSREAEEVTSRPVEEEEEEEEEGELLRVGEGLPMGLFPANRVIGERAPRSHSLPRAFQLVFGEKEDVSSKRSDLSVLALKPEINITGSLLSKKEDVATKEVSEPSTSKMADEQKIVEEEGEADKEEASGGNEEEDGRHRIETPNEKPFNITVVQKDNSSVFTAMLVHRPMSPVDGEKGDTDTGASEKDFGNKEDKAQETDGATAKDPNRTGDSTEPSGTPEAPERAAPRSRWGRWMRRLLRGLAPRDSSSVQQVPKAQSHGSTLVLGLGAARRYPAGPSVSSLASGGGGSERGSRTSNSLSRLFRARTAPAARAEPKEKAKKRKKTKEDKQEKKNNEEEEDVKKEKKDVEDEQEKIEDKDNKEEKKDKEDKKGPKHKVKFSLKKRSTSRFCRAFGMDRGPLYCVANWDAAPSTSSPKFHVGSMEEDTLENIQLDAPAVELQRANSHAIMPCEKDNKNDEECSDLDKIYAIIHKEDTEKRCREINCVIM